MSALTGVATHLADINELSLGFHLNGKKWFDKEAEKQFEEKKKKVNAADYEAQVARAAVMSEKFLLWARSKGYGKVRHVYWTARPGSLQKAVDPTGKIEVNPKENPTDILAEFDRGPANGFLGASAKATKGKSDIGFKNPGLGTIEKELGLDLYKILDNYIDTAVETYNLSTSTSQRKIQIRANKEIQKATQELGSQALSDVIDAMLAKMKKMSPEDLKKHVLSTWMNAGEVYPPYIKVTGMGSKAPFSAKVENPLENDKLTAINSGGITLTKAGNETILVSAGGKHLMKMRAKFESEKLASSFKFSGDPWS